MSEETAPQPFTYLGSPAGQDIPAKLALAMQPAGMAAFACSVLDVTLYSHPKGYLPTFGRFVHVSWPILGAAAGFVLAQNVAGALRKEDDRLNWAVGGAVAGSFFGLWRRSVPKGISLAMAGAAVATLYKYAKDENLPICPMVDSRPETCGIRTLKRDLTLTRHRPGNWTTERQ